MELEEFKDTGMRKSKEGEYFFVHFNKVKRSEEHWNSERYELAEKHDERSYCCDEMRRKFPIMFDVTKPEDKRGFREKEPSLCVLYNTWDEDSCDGWTTYYRIEFCPFCGAEIVLNRVKVYEEYCVKETEVVERCRIKRRQIE